MNVPQSGFTCVLRVCFWRVAVALTSQPGLRLVGEAERFCLGVLGGKSGADYRIVALTLLKHPVLLLLSCSLLSLCIFLWENRTKRTLLVHMLTGFSAV